MGKFTLILHPITASKNTVAKFIGEFDCKIDSKGRIALPSKLRNQFPDGTEQNLVINRGFERCLVLYILDDWNQETEKLSVLNEFNREARKFIRQYNNGANLVSLDNSSRLLIPKKLLDYAEIQDQVVLSAYGNKIEIWSEANYRAEMEFDSDLFAGTAEKLLGKNRKEDASDA